MGKMQDRRRKAKKTKKSLHQLAQELKNTNKIQKAPTPPPGFAHKSKKDYNRKDNQKIINKALSDAE